MPTLTVVSAQAGPAGTVELRPDVFGVGVRVPLLHQSVERELADRRVGTHDTKGRSEVSGGGKKPWRQKGTGRARQGSIRATQWKGGGKPFGPTPRSYAKAMPREMRREALREAMAARIAAGDVTVVDALPAPDGKTRSLVGQLAALGTAGAPALLIVAELGELLKRAARNVPWLSVETPAHTSVYQLLRARKVVIERAALLAMEEALAP